MGPRIIFEKGTIFFIYPVHALRLTLEEEEAQEEDDKDGKDDDDNTKEGERRRNISK